MSKVISHYNFIDKMNVRERLDESGFYIIEKQDNKLIASFKFSTIKDFIILLYGYDFERTP